MGYTSGTVYEIFPIQNYTGDYVKVDNFQLLSSLPKIRSLRFDGTNLSWIMNNPVQLKNVHKLYFKNCFEANGDLKLSHLFRELKEVVFESCYIKIKYFTSSGGYLSTFADDLRKLIHVTKLRIINSQWLKDTELVKIGFMVSLEELMIVDCAYIRDIPNSIRNLKKLKFLKISDTALRELPEEIGELKCLRHLIINNTDRLLKLPDSVGNLVNLEILSVRSCYRLISLPDSIRFLQKLNFLDFHFSRDLKELPGHIGEMKCLRKLQMDHCLCLTKLPESVSDLELLEEVICDKKLATLLWEPLLPKFKHLRIIVNDS